MLKKIGLYFSLGFLVLSLSGCGVLLAGAAGGAGTAAWLSGKLSQNFDATFDKSVNAVKSSLDSLDFEIDKETMTDDVTQIISEYTDGKTIWIDIRPLTSNSTKIEVRVGAIPDKDSAQLIMDKITSKL